MSASAAVWALLAAPLANGAMSWRQDGKPIQRDGKILARFVAYVNANTVRDRLDSVAPGQWSLALEVLPSTQDEDAAAQFAFKARLTVLGVAREDVGVGKDYKQASTDAFKRAAVGFGIGHELYQLGTNWVELDGDGKFAKPREDPQAAYDRRHRTISTAAAPPARTVRPPAPPLIDPRIPRGAPAPSRAGLPSQPPPHEDEDGLPF